MVDLLNPEKVLSQVPLKEEMSVADFGCGSGGWVIPLAKMKKDAKIHAIDVLEEALSALRSRAEMERVYNIRTILADVEKGTGLASSSLDFVLMTNILFQVEDKDSLIDEASRVLTKGGMLLLVEWEIKEDNTKEKVDKKFQEKGFKKIKDIHAGETHFAYLYEKN